MIDNFIFTEASSKIGLGHLTRCLALYDELESRCLNPVLVVNGDQPIKEVLGNRKHHIDYWYENWADYLKNKKTSKANCIIDSYIAEEKTYYDICMCCKKALFIDDTSRIDYPDGIIVNPSFYGDKLPYKTRSSQLLLTGPNHIILRKEFQRGYKRKAKADIEDILLILGGSDIWNLTPEILKILNKLKWIRANKHIVAGNSFTNVDTIKTMIANMQDFKLYQNLNSHQLYQLMSECDYAITAAGQTVYELISMQLPFSCVKIIDNQTSNINGLIDYQMITDYLDFSMQRNIDELEKFMIQSIKIMRNVKERNRQIEIMSRIDLGKGVERIIDALIK